MALTALFYHAYCASLLAERAGVRRGDHILEVDGTTVAVLGVAKVRVAQRMVSRGHCTLVLGACAVLWPVVWGEGGACWRAFAFFDPPVRESRSGRWHPE